MTTTLGNRENQLRACQPKEKQYKFQIINFINTQMKKKKKKTHLKERGGNPLPPPPQKKLVNEVTILKKIKNIWYRQITNQFFNFLSSYNIRIRVVIWR